MGLRRYNYFTGEGVDFRCQNLTSNVCPRAERVNHLNLYRSSLKVNIYDMLLWNNQVWFLK